MTPSDGRLDIPSRESCALFHPLLNLAQTLMNVPWTLPSKQKSYYVCCLPITSETSESVPDGIVSDKNRIIDCSWEVLAMDDFLWDENELTCCKSLYNIA